VPWNSTRPDVGSASRLNSRSSVDLPEPLGPRLDARLAVAVHLADLLE